MKTYYLQHAVIDSIIKAGRQKSPFLCPVAIALSRAIALHPELYQEDIIPDVKYSKAFLIYVCPVCSYRSIYAESPLPPTLGQWIKKFDNRGPDAVPEISFGMTFTTIRASSPCDFCSKPISQPNQNHDQTTHIP